MVAMDSPAEQIAEASAALENAIAAGTHDALAAANAGSDTAAATVEQIADAPSAVVNEPVGVSAAEVLAVAAEAPQA